MIIKYDKKDKQCILNRQIKINEYHQNRSDKDKWGQRINKNGNMLLGCIQLSGYIYGLFR